MRAARPRRWFGCCACRAKSITVPLLSLAGDSRRVAAIPGIRALRLEGWTTSRASTSTASQQRLATTRRCSSDGEWRLDLDALRAAVTERTRVVFLNSASFPTGWVASAEEWDTVAVLCTEQDVWLLYWGGLEAVLYDGRRVLHPAALPGMRERTVIVGAPSGEQRMIAWRVGWVVMPSRLRDLVSRAQIYNGRVASGFAQIGTKAALEVGDEDVAAATAEWQRRRDETVRPLDGLPVVPPHGAWAALLDTEALGVAPAELSARLLEHKVAATPMDGWGGDVAARHLRFVFSNAPVERLALLRERVRAALG